MNEQDRAFKAAQRAQLKARTALLAGTRDQLVALLNTARDQITLTLAQQPTDYQQWSLPQLQAEVNRVASLLGESSASVLNGAAGRAGDLGQDLIDAPLNAGLAAGGRAARIEAVAPRINLPQLQAMRTFMTGRIKDVSQEAAGKINTQLGLVVMGSQNPSEAISAVQSILGDDARRRATTIVRTELGRVYATASYERLLQTHEHAPMDKVWRRSGKVHSRLEHDLADGQRKPADQPFEIRSRQTGQILLMRYPHDPKAPASETINCGCVMVPKVRSWASTLPDKRR